MPTRVQVQFPGFAYRMSAAALREQFNRSDFLRRLFAISIAVRPPKIMTWKFGTTIQLMRNMTNPRRLYSQELIIFSRNDAARPSGLF